MYYNTAFSSVECNDIAFSALTRDWVKEKFSKNILTSLVSSQ